MAMLDPDMLAYLQRLNLGAAGQPTDGATPPPPATVQAPAAHASSDVGPNPMQDLMRQYVQNYGSAGLRNAQRQDVGDLITNRTGRQLAGAASLISGANVTPPDVAQPWHAAQFGQGRELAGQNMQMAGQMLAMDPNSPMSRIKVETAKGLGLPVGPGWSAWHVDQLLDAMGKGQAPMKTAADIQNTLAGAGKARAETTATEIGNSPISGGVRAALSGKGITVPEGTPTSVVEKITGPQVTRLEGAAGRANSVHLAQMEIDKWRAENQAQNPKAVAPGATYSGPKLFPTKEDTEPFYAVYTPGVETMKNLDAYAAKWEEAGKKPTLLADPAWRQEMNTLYESTFPAIAKKNAGGNSAPLAEIGAAQAALAKPGVTAQVLGRALPAVRSSTATLKAITRRDIEHVGRTHFIDVNLDAPEGAKPPGAGMPHVLSDLDYDHLASGTKFIAPDGSTRTKP